MKANMIGLFTETMMHPGSGQHNGAIDLPVAREATTNYPVVVGSSMKGALRDKAVQEIEKKSVSKIFGEQENAGVVAVTDARLLLLPVRSLQGHYRWVTCPYILERFCRDAALAGKSISLEPPRVDPGEALVIEDMETLLLEELSFQAKPDANELKAWVDQIRPLIHHKDVRKRLTEQLAVVNDDDFAYLARYSLPIQIRNQLDKNKISQHLWSEETLPPDTLLYTLLIARPGGESELEKVVKHLNENPYIQIGGNETLGQGWCIIATDEKEVD